jgi:hypothetical protein
MGRTVLLLLFSLGCGSTAIITHHDGRRLEATILSSSQEAIRVDGGRWREPMVALADVGRSGTDLEHDGDSGKPKARQSSSPEVGTANRSEPSDGDTDTEITTRILRLEIKDIDHPGNGVATLGALLVAWGLYRLYPIVVNGAGCGQADAALCVGQFVPSVLGIGLTLYGGSVYSRSVAAASGMGREPGALQLRILPAFQLARDSTSAGLQVGAVF